MTPLTKKDVIGARDVFDRPIGVLRARRVKPIYEAKTENDNQHESDSGKRKCAPLRFTRIARRLNLTRL